MKTEDATILATINASERWQCEHRAVVLWQCRNCPGADRNKVRHAIRMWHYMRDSGYFYASHPNLWEG